MNSEWIVSLYTVLVITTGLTRIFLVHKQKMSDMWSGDLYNYVF